MRYINHIYIVLIRAQYRFHGTPSIPQFAWYDGVLRSVFGVAKFQQESSFSQRNSTSCLCSNMVRRFERISWNYTCSSRTAYSDGRYCFSPRVVLTLLAEAGEIPVIFASVSSTGFVMLEVRGDYSFHRFVWNCCDVVLTVLHCRSFRMPLHAWIWRTIESHPDENGRDVKQKMFKCNPS